jgi:hypothetical protein
VIYVLDSHKIELISPAEGQVLQEGRIRVCPKPSLYSTVYLPIQVLASSFPALKDWVTGPSGDPSFYALLEEGRNN